MHAIPTRSLLFKCLTAMLLCFSLLIPVQTASAKGKSVSNSTAANLLTTCMLAGDARTQRNKSRTKVRCCSSSEGFCITCNMDGSGLCKKSRYSVKFPPWMQDQIGKPNKNAPQQSKANPRKPTSFNGATTRNK